MASVKIKNATVEGVFAGKGFRCSTSYKDQQGNDRKDYYKVWTENTPKEGDVLDIEGLLRVRIEEYTNRDGEAKTIAAVHINNPKIEYII